MEVIFATVCVFLYAPYMSVYVQFIVLFFCELMSYETVIVITPKLIFQRFEPLTEEQWLPLRHHFSSRVRMRTNHLATKCNYYARLLN